MTRCVWTRSLVRAFSSSVESHSFRQQFTGRLSNSVLGRLCAQGITAPNTLQRKCLASLLDGQHKAAVINAETGSGKTYCFLLPILKLFDNLSSSVGCIPASSSVILAPTPHLAYQIQSVYRALAEPRWDSCVTHTHSRLILTPTTSLVIATPTSLVQYDLNRVLRHTQLLCVDEADILLTGSERQATWSIMDTLRGRLESISPEKSGSSGASIDSTGAVNALQYIFTAATLPSGGRQTVQSRLKKWLPRDTLHITTDNTHRLSPTAQLRFVDMTAVSDDAPDSHSLSTLKQRQLVEDLQELGTTQNSPKILIFLNSVSNADRLYHFLTKPDLSTSIIAPWWTEKVGQLYKQENTTISALEDSLRQFESGDVQLLVCSDLGCRGLDLSDVTAVIQYEFPRNVAEFIHRAGRTARAGRSGHVISYVDKESRDLANKIRDAVNGVGQTLEQLFSRNKMLRRKLKNRASSEKPSVTA